MAAALNLCHFFGLVLRTRHSSLSRKCDGFCGLYTICTARVKTTMMKTGSLFLCIHCSSLGNRFNVSVPWSVLSEVAIQEMDNNMQVTDIVTILIGQLPSTISHCFLDARLLRHRSLIFTATVHSFKAKHRKLPQSHTRVPTAHRRTAPYNSLYSFFIPQNTDSISPS